MGASTAWPGVSMGQAVGRLVGTTRRLPPTLLLFSNPLALAPRKTSTTTSSRSMVAHLHRQPRPSTGRASGCQLEATSLAFNNLKYYYLTRRFRLKLPPGPTEAGAGAGTGTGTGVASVLNSCGEDRRAPTRSPLCQWQPQVPLAAGRPGPRVQLEAPRPPLAAPVPWAMPFCLQLLVVLLVAAATSTSSGRLRLPLVLPVQGAGVSASEAVALADLYSASGGSTWTSSTRWLSGDPCINAWTRVSCSGGTTVT